MLLANKKVAELFIKQKKGIFRIHDFPDDEKIITLERITKKHGCDFHGNEWRLPACD